MMSNVETAPTELRCGETPGGSGVQILAAREVPLGGPRAMRVRRSLPQRARSLIGAWCFVDHYGPDDVGERGGMDVPPHPHTGLQTASWLFSGEIEHRDSMGSHALIRPGELNLMTGGHGICHCEVSTPNTYVLHGVQLWIALPDAHRHTGRDFRHYAPPVVAVGGGSARVFLGTLADAVSPVPTFSPLLGAELVIEPGRRVSLTVQPEFEHGVLADGSGIVVAGTPVARSEIGYVGVGRSSLEIANSGSAPAQVLLLGGEPFAEDILMWWNFVGRSHAEIVAFRDAWQAESDQFGAIDAYTGAVRRLPAPPLPNATLRPRPHPAN
jgi:redox-sensitive bicupin YhaK (pirin superfamily)